MKKIQRLVITTLQSIALTSTVFLSISRSFAQDVVFPNVTQVTDTDIMGVLTNIANWLFTLAGGLAVLFLIYGGVTYITGGAKAEETAKKLIMNSIIGLVIIALSYVIAKLAVDLVQGV